jgi:hypothetical protein
MRKQTWIHGEKCRSFSAVRAAGCRAAIGFDYYRNGEYLALRLLGGQDVTEERISSDTCKGERVVLAKPVQIGTVRAIFIG